MSMSSPCSDDWQHAAYIPGPDHELKTIVAAPFHLPSFIRPAILQARARELGWCVLRLLLPCCMLLVWTLAFLTLSLYSLRSSLFMRALSPPLTFSL